MNTKTISKERFIKNVYCYMYKYSKELIEQFVKYWTAERFGVMRFRYERSFDIGNRLARMEKILSFK